MEVEPNIAVLGVTKGIEIVPPPCTDTRACILIAFMVEAMLPVVVIEGKDRNKPRLKGLLVRVPMYNKKSK